LTTQYVTTKNYQKNSLIFNCKNLRVLPLRLTLLFSLLSMSLSKHSLCRNLSTPPAILFPNFVLVVLGFFETVSHYVVHAGLELKILLPPPPEWWDYGCVPSHPPRSLH
jgi:hypothetical protein